MPKPNALLKEVLHAGKSKKSKPAKKTKPNKVIHHPPIRHSFGGTIDKLNVRKTTTEEGVVYYVYLGGYLDEAQVEARLRDAQEVLAPKLLARVQQGPVIAQLQAQLTLHHRNSNQWKEIKVPDKTNHRHRLHTVNPKLMTRFWQDSIDTTMEEIEFIDDILVSSGWRVVMVDWVQLDVQDDKITGGKYIPTPAGLSQKAVLNIKNEDDRCGRFALLGSHFHTRVNRALKDKCGPLYDCLCGKDGGEEDGESGSRRRSFAHPTRFREDPAMYELLDQRFKPFKWPKKTGAWGYSEFDEFERLNPGHLCDVYFLETDKQGKVTGVYPWRIEHTSLEEMSGKTIHRVGLLGDRNLVDGDDVNHYVTLLNMSSMLRDHHNQEYKCKSNTNSYDICRICLTPILHKYMEAHMKQHEITGCGCRIQLPLPGKHKVSAVSKPVFHSDRPLPPEYEYIEKLKLTVKHSKKYQCFMVADFECTTKEQERLDSTESNTEVLHKHEPNSFTLWWFVQKQDRCEVDHFTYVGTDPEDTMAKFTMVSQQKGMELKQFMQTYVPLTHIPDTHSSATRCHICHNHVLDGFEELTPIEAKVYGAYKKQCAKAKGKEEKAMVVVNYLREYGDVFRNAIRKQDWIKVADHDHHTGAYLGAAHNQCNREHTVANESIQCFIHNGKGYDFHLIIKHLRNSIPLTSFVEGEEEEQQQEQVLDKLQTSVSIIPLNKQQFLTVRLNHVQYKDSLQFFQAPLTKVVDAMVVDANKQVNLTLVQQNMPRFVGWVKSTMKARGLRLSPSAVAEGLELLARKGVYPYTYVQSPVDFAKRGMWPREALDQDPLNDLVNAKQRREELEKVLESEQGDECAHREWAYLSAAIEAQQHKRDKDYQHATKVWKFFRCETFEDYHRLYLEADGVLLLDAIQNFREIAIKEDGLDPLHFFGVPGLTYASFLNYHMEHNPQIPLECITVQHILDFVMHGLRGGICVNNVAHAKANNPFMKSYDPNRPKSYIIYLDANNLYAWAMMQCLPCGEYHWVPAEEHDYILHDELPHLADDAPHGYFFMVDIKPPQGVECMERLQEYPLCPEVKVSPSADKGCKTQKLILDMLPKEKYVMHYRTLKFAREQGYEVTKVHKVLKFRQAPFIKGYIELQTERRQAAKGNKFKQDYYKLKNNSLYGKFIENKMNRIDYSIVQPRTYDRERRHPRYLGGTPINDGEMYGLLRQPKVAKVDTLNATGVAILELSKLHMQQFHYNVMKAEYGDKARLLYTDTDSLIYHITTDNVYEDMSTKEKLKDAMDMSGFAGKADGGKSDLLKGYYSKHNYKVIGKFKEEGEGDVITEWYGVAPKVYLLEKEDAGHKCKAKGTNKTVTEKEMVVSDYAAVATGPVGVAPVRKTNTCIQSKDHQLCTIRTNKIAYQKADNKRQWVYDKKTERWHSFAWGCDELIKARGLSLT